MLVMVNKKPHATIQPAPDAYPNSRPNTPIASALAVMSVLRSTRSMIGNDRADPIGYPMNVNDTKVSEVTIE